MNMKNVEFRTNFNALMNSFNEMLVLRYVKFHLFFMLITKLTRMFVNTQHPKIKNFIIRYINLRNTLD